MNATPDKVVLVLGAGASAASDFRLPVMHGFFGPYQAEFPAMFSFLDQFFSGGDPSTWNLEDVLTFLSVSRDRMRLWGMKPCVGGGTSYDDLYAVVLRYIAKRLEIPKDGVCKVHVRLLSSLAPTDSILSLNYDLVADQALLDIEPKEGRRPHQNCRIGKVEGLLAEQNYFDALQPPSLMPREKEWGFYLKLHGSLDWLRCPTAGCRNHANIFASRLSGVGTGQEAGLPCRSCGAAVERMIIPPVATKQLEERGRVAFLWHLALRELRDATKVVFIGVSLAPTDFDLHWLIREGIGCMPARHLTIAIVNPEVSHRKRISALIPSSQSDVSEYPSIDEYLAP